jgi:sec-independent protein translocase protein TatA
MPIGFGEIAIIFFVILLIFGPKKLPELFRSFGKGIKEFKKAQSEVEDDIRTAMESEPEVRKPSVASDKDPHSTKLQRDR